MTKPVPFIQAMHSWMDVAMHRSMRGWSHHAKATGLSMPQFSILMQLYYRGNCGISDISDRFEISAAAASQHVDNLVQAGLIERTEDSHDRRVRQIQLSPKGRNLLDKGIHERYRWMDRLEETLDEKARERIAEALVILTEAARKIDLS
jgi:MarR family 2-MHQ and catechol resistance regulon transcriptional repressor